VIDIFTIVFCPDLCVRKSEMSEDVRVRKEKENVGLKDGLSELNGQQVHFPVGMPA